MQLVDTTYEATKDTLVSRIALAQQALDQAATATQEDTKPQVKEQKEVAKEKVKAKTKAVVKTKAISGEQLLKNYITDIELTKGY